MAYIVFNGSGTSNSKAKMLKGKWRRGTTGYFMIADKVMQEAEDAGIFDDVVQSNAGKNRNRYYCLAVNKENLTFVKVMSEGNGYSDYVIVSTLANMNEKPVNIPKNLAKISLRFGRSKGQIHEPGSHRILVSFKRGYRLGLMVKYLEEGKVDVEKRNVLPVLEGHHIYADFDFRCGSIALLTKEEHKKLHNIISQKAHYYNTIIDNIYDLKEFIRLINSDEYYNYYHEMARKSV